MTQGQSVGAEGADLADQLRRGDGRAWQRLFSRQKSRIFGLCYRMLRNRGDAEDATQEVFERAFRSIGGFREESSLETWLHRIAMNLCLTRLATTRRSNDTAELPTDLAGDDIPADRVAASSQLRSAVERALGELEPEFRGAVLLRDVEGHSYDEIAQIMNIPIETVKTRIHRGRTRLQQRLAEFRL